MTARAAVSAAIAATIGLLLVYATAIGFVLSIVMPPLCFLQERRRDAFLVAFSYYASASFILIPAAKEHFGPDGNLQVFVVLWVTAASLLAFPFWALWSARRPKSLWRASLAVLASVPPPLGLIGWANPVTAAGILFPATGWFGLLGVLLFVALVPRFPLHSIAGVAVCALVANASFRETPEALPDWEIVNTNFGDTSPEHASMLKQFEVAQQIQQRALQSRARIVVFPEAVVPNWNDATDAFWQSTFSSLAAAGKTLVVGATVEIPGSRRHANVVMIRGAGTGAFIQRIPTPIAEWHLLGDKGMPLNANGPGVIEIAGQRVAFLFPYEKFLTWPIVTSVASKPTLLLEEKRGLVGTRVEMVGSTALASFVRLFSLKFHHAVVV